MHAGETIERGLRVLANWSGVKLRTGLSCIPGLKKNGVVLNRRRWIVDGWSGYQKGSEALDMGTAERCLIT